MIQISPKKESQPIHENHYFLVWILLSYSSGLNLIDKKLYLNLENDV